MKILVASPKGGVGKSAVSVQIFCPWLAARSQQKVNYIVCDKVNGSFYEQVDNGLFTTRVIRGDENALDAITSCRNCVVDVGGNYSYLNLIKALKEQMVLRAFDVIALPLKSDLDDADSAKSAYNEIRAEVKDGTRFIWFLVGSDPEGSGDSLTGDFIDFFGDEPVQGYAYVKGGVNGVMRVLPEKDRNWLAFPPSHLEAVAKRYAMPICELAKKDISKEIAKLESLMANPDADPKEIKALRHFIYVFKRARRYTDDTLMPIYRRLDEICKGIK